MWITTSSTVPASASDPHHTAKAGLTAVGWTIQRSASGPAMADLSALPDRVLAVAKAHDRLNVTLRSLDASRA